MDNFNQLANALEPPVSALQINFSNLSLQTNFFIYLFKQIGMEAPEFKDFAKEMVDYIAEYLENIRDR